MAGYELFSAPLVCAQEIFISFCRRQPERKKSGRQTLFTRETYIALFKIALSVFEKLDRLDLIHRKRRCNLSDYSRKHRRDWQLTLAILGESENRRVPRSGSGHKFTTSNLPPPSMIQRKQGSLYKPFFEHIRPRSFFVMRFLTDDSRHGTFAFSGEY